MDDGEFLRTFPELQKIKDEELRNKVIAVWQDATQGNIEKLKKITIPNAVRKITLIDHTRRITQMAMAIAIVRRNVNMDWLIAGAILHDVGMVMEQDSAGGDALRVNLLAHPVSSVLLCAKHGLPHEVMHIVSMHEEETGHMLEESIILRHCVDIENEIAMLEKRENK
jgi:putative nucleotidyltransferase with HDIG domain